MPPSSRVWSSQPCQSERAKRVLDVTVAVLAILLCLPLMLLASLAVLLSGPGPILLRQDRIGRYEKPFQMLKFRTMHVEADDRRLREMNTRELKGEEPDTSDGVFKLQDDPRITPVGRWLRHFSIDELPQLFNVLRGDMSLVGPRPSLPWEVDLFTPEQRQRHACLPGMTGLWQVSGRNRLSMPEMLKLDIVYLRSRSLLLDLRILARTPAAVLLDRSVR
ncbi:sugar transferase [Roseomonas sp. KE2513]|uniref:sugar transferase n=1 Tax=Roseomonas sp. KE2513 TaxID=2479202 RepID=UPI0018E03713|nr:sugar transferase [Roseomonas sp. KE2513]MBI0535445.1 sugar transferase [Roseomonas sp. KE2513]